LIAANAHNGAGTEPLLNEILKRIGVAQAVAVLCVLGRYVSHAIIVNSLAIEAPAGSIFDPDFTE